MAKEKTKQVNVYLPPDLAEKLQHRADKQRRSLSAQVAVYIEQAMAMEDTELAARMMRA